jgi:hypothetical protein
MVIEPSGTTEPPQKKRVSYAVANFDWFYFAKAHAASDTTGLMTHGGLFILVLAREYENKLFSCCFETQSRLFSSPFILITFVRARLMLAGGRWAHRAMVTCVALNNLSTSEVRRES